MLISFRENRTALLEADMVVYTCSHSSGAGGRQRRRIGQPGSHCETVSEQKRQTKCTGRDPCDQHVPQGTLLASCQSCGMLQVERKG